jgi:hypothetical protein
MFFFRLFTHCSARVSILVIVLSDNPREMGDVSDFEIGQIVVARLAGASVIKTCHIIRCIESDSF